MLGSRPALVVNATEDEGAASRRKPVHRVVKCAGCWWDRRPHYHCSCGRMIFSVGAHLRSAEQRDERVEPR